MFFHQETLPKKIKNERCEKVDRIKEIQHLLRFETGEERAELQKELDDLKEELSYEF